MAQFIGLAVEVRLVGSAAPLRGTIFAVDSQSGTLHLESNVGTRTAISRSSIEDLELLPVQSAQPRQLQHQQNGGATGSSATQRPQTPTGPKAMSAASHPQTRLPPPPHLVASSSSSSSSPSASPAQLAVRNGMAATSANAKKKKSKTKSAGVVDVANLSTGAGSNMGTNGRSTSKQLYQPENDHKTVLAFDEDFDFSKGLQAFDKQRVWNEIRSADQTDPSSLLVSHNRVNASSEDDSVSAGRGRMHRNGQTKLGNHEMVLSPSPPPSHDGDNDAIAGESGRGSAPVSRQPARKKVTPPLHSSELAENISSASVAALQAELALLRERASLLETLTTLDLDIAPGPHPAQTLTRTWHCTLWATPASRAVNQSLPAATRLAAPAIAGSLRFALTTSASEPGRMRYFPPDPASRPSDNDLVDRLPPQYQREMGLRDVSAPVFIKRLGDVISGDPSA